MITSQTEFENTYGVNDGEIASEIVLNRPSFRLKTELNDTSYLVDALYGDVSRIPAWGAGSYESGQLRSHDGKIWKSLQDNNTSTPGTDIVKWEDLSDLIASFSAIAGGAGGAEILVYPSSSGFPVTGAEAKLYIAEDTNEVSRWDGVAYVAVSGAGGAGYVNEYINLTAFPVSGSAGALYVAQDTNKVYRYDAVSGYIELAPGSGSVSEATNLSGGDANRIAYQSAPNVTGFISAPTVTDTYLKYNGSSFTWSAVAGGTGSVSVLDDVSTDATYYPAFSTVTSGTITEARVSSTKLTFNPNLGSLGATEFNATSDLLKKTQIAQISGAVETLGAIRGVNFKWIESGADSSGVIAQEVQEVIPSIVSSGENGLSVNYNGLVGYLIEAIRELNARILELEGGR